MGGSQDEADKLDRLRRDVAALEGAACVACAAVLCGHEAVTCVVMGFRGAPRCGACIAVALERALPELRGHVREHVAHRDCFHRVWQEVSVREDGGASCSWVTADTAVLASRLVPSDHDDEEDGPPTADERWDAGSMGCGELVLALRVRLGELAPRTVLEVRAEDPGAREDLPAWCRMTGHALIAAEHPRYWIRRRA